MNRILTAGNSNSDRDKNVRHASDILALPVGADDAKSRMNRRRIAAGGGELSMSGELSPEFPETDFIDQDQACRFEVPSQC
jgi:hypothetical protein